MQRRNANNRNLSHQELFKSVLHGKVTENEFLKLKEVLEQPGFSTDQYAAILRSEEEEKQNEAQHQERSANVNIGQIAVPQINGQIPQPQQPADLQNPGQRQYISSSVKIDVDEITKIESTRNK